jgi:hypothetical protein
VYNKKKKPIMSLEKAIKKLTEVIQAATPAPGTGPAPDSPRGRDPIPCKGDPKKGSPGYCDCYKKNNIEYAGPCYYRSSIGKCYMFIYHAGPGIPDRDEYIGVNGECPIGIPGVE